MTASRHPKATVSQPVTGRNSVLANPPTLVSASIARERARSSGYQATSVRNAGS